MLLCGWGIARAAATELTAGERQWLRAHPTITVATYGHGWPPFEEFEDGELRGLAPDYLREIARQYGMRVEVRRYETFEAAMDAACRRHVDVLMNVSLVPERTSCLVFTSAYVHAIPTIIGPARRSELLGPDSLVRARIAVDRETSVEHSVSARFPKARVIPVDDTRDGLTLVERGQADAFVGNPYVAHALLATGQWPSLATLTPTNLPTDTLHFAVPDDRKPLTSLIDKGLAAMSAQQRAQIDARWLGTSFQPTTRLGGVPLTAEEQLWLGRIHPLRLGYYYDWEPIAFVGDDGRLSGIAGDYVQLLQTRLGLRIGTQKASDLKGIAALRADGKVDLVPLPSGAPLGPGWTTTRPFTRIGNVIVMRTGSHTIGGLADLGNKRVAVAGVSRGNNEPAAVTGMSREERITDAAPGALIVLVDSKPEGLRAVKEGRADAFVGDAISIDRLLRSGEFGGLRVAAPAGFDDEVVFAVRGEYGPLVPLIDRMLAGMSADEQQSIRSSWLKVDVYRGADWRTVAIAGAIAVIVILAIGLAYMRTRAEIRKRERADALMRDLTRNLPGVIVTSTRDAAGNFTIPFAAGNTRALFGLDLDDLIRDAPGAVSRVHPADAERVEVAFAKSFRDLTPVEMDIRTVPPAPERWIRVNAVPRRADDGVVHWSAYWIDVTATHLQAEALRAAKEQAEASAASRAGFLAAMSHEIRTPMSGITGLIEILSRSEVNDDQRHLLGLVRDYTEALGTILDDVLDFSRIESGRLELEPVETDVGALMCSSLELVMDLYRRKNLRCVCHIDPGLAGTMLVDPTRLRQIALNLLSNAIKFTAEGFVALSVEVLAQDDDTQTWCLAVADTGIGISPEDQGKLFQPFSQAALSTSRHYGGSGLGLAICRRLAALMQAELSLESTPGVGTRVYFTMTAPVVRRSAFDADLAGRTVAIRCSDQQIAQELATILETFGAHIVTEPAPADVVIGEDRQPTDTRFIPLVADSPDTPGNAIIAQPLLPTHVRRACLMALSDAVGRQAPPSARKTMREGRILVAEDHSTNQLLLHRQLAEIGYACRVVPDGEQALAALREEPFDMLITDLQMPRMSGFELARRIRADEAAEGRAPMPILALSAGVHSDDEARCLAAGMNGHLRKPIGLDEMMTKLEQWLPAPNATPDRPDASERQPQSPTPEETTTLPAPTASAEQLDFQVLVRAFGSMETVVLVAEDLLASLPADVDELRESCKARSAPRMGRALHRISGAFGAFGYRELAGELRQATHHAEAGTPLSSEEVDLLLNRIERTAEQLETFVATRKTKVG